jgi:hypothetical protein
MASGARQDLADSAGLDLTETVDTVKSLQEFHPRRLAANILKDEPDAAAPAAKDKQGDRPVFDPDAT